MTIDKILITLILIALMYSGIVWFVIGAMWSIVSKGERPGAPSWLTKIVAKNIKIIADNVTVQAKSMGITVRVTQTGSPLASERLAEELATEISTWLSSTTGTVEYTICRKQT